MNIDYLLQHWESGAIKMFVTACGLRLRRRWPELFAKGAYIPLEAQGEQASRIVAFARRLDTRMVITVVPRLVASARGWEQTFLRLPTGLVPAQLFNVLTQTSVFPHASGSGYTLKMTDLLARCPVGLFTASLKADGTKRSAE